MDPTQAATTLINYGALGAVCILQALAIVWLWRAARNDAKAAQEKFIETLEVRDKTFQTALDNRDRAFALEQERQRADFRAELAEERRQCHDDHVQIMAGVNALLQRPAS